MHKNTVFQSGADCVCQILRALDCISQNYRSSSLAHFSVTHCSCLGAKTHGFSTFPIGEFHVHGKINDETYREIQCGRYKYTYQLNVSSMRAVIFKVRFCDIFCQCYIAHWIQLIGLYYSVIQCLCSSNFWIIF